jgi:glycine/D-amino acid oxidase-like deaminating enzyme
MKLIVIGAGIAGSSATRIARDKGWDVTLIDHAPEQSASRSALATIRPTWFDKAERADLERSWEWYSKWGAAGTREAYVSNWKNREVKAQKDWWLVDPIVPLLKPDTIERVVRISNNDVELSSGLSINADAILNCTGAYGADLARDVSLFAGVTWISHDAELDYSPYRVHHLRPYKSLSAAQINGVTRVGSSIAATADKAIQEAEELLEQAHLLGIVQAGATWEMSLGWRAKGKGGIPIYPELGQRNAYFSGLARSGYGLSPAIAEKWIDSLP